MSDRGPTFDDQFEADTKPVKLENLGHSGDAQTLQNINSQSSSSTCGEDGCPLKNNVEVETAWQNLMSAVPRADDADGSNIRPENDLSHAIPVDLDRIIRSVRPEGAADHALDSLSTAWDDSVVIPLADLPGLLQTYTTQLSEEWTGDDFDALEKNVEELIKIAQEVVDSSTEIKDMLYRESGEIYAAQGGPEGFIPFPAPQLWTKEQNWFVGIFKDDYVHCRPPWWTGGQCNHITPDYALQMVGFPQGTMEEINGQIDSATREQQASNQAYNEEVMRYIEQGGSPMAYPLKSTDWDELYIENRDKYLLENEDTMSQVNTDYVQASEDINNDIIGREYNANTTYSTHQDPTTPKQPTSAAENNNNLTPGGGGGGGGGGGMPPGGGMPSTDYPGMDEPTTPEFDPGGLGEDGGYEPNPNKDYTLPGTGDSDPWKPSTPDLDDPSGGLASGGGLGGGGGGLGGGLGGGAGGGMGGGLGGGAGGGLGAGMGAGGMGGMMGGAGGGRGAGAGAGGGRGAGGRGAGGPKGMGRGGMAGGMMGGAGGGRGMGGPGEDGQESGTWLTEDDDVWGIGNEEEDPYA
ncbi:hypothetical protein AB0K52_20345 [Glycomyces sp. NPDC049804]|uniref:hypothetical protein n=1 Tax=Glycomyces sp. NPDC049804 TaxID=3154363 RepID=UPI00342AB8D1